jgi:hypothetical protein
MLRLSLDIFSILCDEGIDTQTIGYFVNNNSPKIISS